MSSNLLFEKSRFAAMGCVIKLRLHYHYPVSFSFYFFLSRRQTNEMWNFVRARKERKESVVRGRKLVRVSLKKERQWEEAARVCGLESRPSIFISSSRVFRFTAADVTLRK